MILLLLVFVGQTMAYSMMASYGSISELQTSTQFQSSSIEHASEGNASDDDCCDIECCESECICPANACASMVYLDSNLPLSNLAVITESLNLLSTQATFFIATSFFRPPIFTS
jgi:hypothetical protein